MIALIFLGSSLHQPFYADTREPLSRIALTTRGVEGALADEVSLVGADGDPLAWRVGIEAGAFMGFQAGGELTFNLITFDGQFGVPVDLRWSGWDARVEWRHVSSHFADGVRFSEDRPQLDGLHSREWASVILSRRLSVLRPYVGLRWLVHAADGARGGGGQLGFTSDCSRALGPYAGADAQISAEVGWRPTVAGQVGLRARGEQGRVMRAGLAAFDGVTDVGRERPEHQYYLGFSVSFQGALVVPPGG